MRLNVYVDGFNLFYGCLRGTAYRWLDLTALSRRLFPKDEIHRIRYFTALVSPRPDDPQKLIRQQAYLRALAADPLVSIHFGHYLTSNVRMRLANPPARGPKTAEVIKTEEKGSDVNIATYLLLDGFRSDYEAAVVVSNDSDLKEPVAVVRNVLGLPVGIVNPHPAARRSRALVGTFFKQIRPATLAACQLPSVVPDAAGQVRKPQAW